MTRSRLASCAGRWGLVLLLALGGGPASWAQPAAMPPASSPVAPRADSAVAAAPQPAASNLTWLWVLLGGVALGVLGARLWARKSRVGEGRSKTSAAPPMPGPPPKKPAENVMRPPVVQSLRQVQGSVPEQAASTKASNKQPGSGKKPKPNHNSRTPPPPARSPAWPPVPHRPSAMNPTPPTVPPTGDQPLETGQTIEWAAPASTPPAIQEMIAASEPATTSAPEAAAETPANAPAVPVPGNGPLHYYAPAPDVPSIEHRKLSSNPLPQMPLLITLPHAEATTAQFSFSPQADQSRIIGNGVRELKEFFQFELPSTEQFTSIRNLKPGRLEKRDDTWHVVQKAEIALS